MGITSILLVDLQGQNRGCTRYQAVSNSCLHNIGFVLEFLLFFCHFNSAHLLRITLANFLSLFLCLHYSLMQPSLLNQYLIRHHHPHCYLLPLYDVKEPPVFLNSQSSSFSCHSWVIRMNHLLDHLCLILRRCHHPYNYSFIC